MKGVNWIIVKSTSDWRRKNVLVLLTVLRLLLLSLKCFEQKQKQFRFLSVSSTQEQDPGTDIIKIKIHTAICVKTASSLSDENLASETLPICVKHS